MSIASTIAQRLDLARRELLDLSLRNNLLNYRLPKSRGVGVAKARAEQVFSWLVSESRKLTFIPAPESDDTVASTPREPNGKSAPALHAIHVEANLQARLLATYYAARTHIEERGINILFMAIGMLHWFEDEASEKELTAPLLLVPVELQRTSAQEKFTLRYDGEDIEENLSLASKLSADYRIRYPELADTDELDVREFLNEVAKSVAGQRRWRLEPDEMVLGLFSFGKLLMYRDLAPETWCTKENPDGSPILASLLRDGFRDQPSAVSDDAYLDKLIAPDLLHQVVDADSSQALAMLDVRSGRHLVVQGPPGTGKSQTITNVVADAIGQGKRVLFVAEKMAALEVVKRRLDKVGMGEACLELHSHSANKKTVLAELQRTLQLGKPRDGSGPWQLEHYKQLRDQLNGYCLAVNEPVGGSGFTPRDLMGALSEATRELASVNVPRPSFDASGNRALVEAILSWDRAAIEQKQMHVGSLQAHLGRMGVPSLHPFRDARRGALLPSDRQTIARAIRATIESAQVLEAAVRDLGSFMGIAARCDRSDAEVLARAGRRALAAPHLQGIELRTGDWQAKRDQLAALLAAGEQHTAIRKKFSDVLIPEAWDQNLLPARQTLTTLGRKWWRWLSSDYRRVRNEIAGLCKGEQARDVGTQLGLVDAIMEAARLRKALLEHRALGAYLYGVQWQGLASDWPVLRRIADWIITLYRDVGDGAMPRGIIDFLAGSPRLDALRGKVTAVEEALAVYDKALPLMFEGLDISESGRDAFCGTELPAQLAALGEMERRLDDLPQIVTFNNLCAVLQRESLSWVIDAAWDWPEAASKLVFFYRSVCFETLLRKAYAEREVLRSFDGQTHEQVRDRFRELDLASLRATQVRLAREHWSQLPSPHGHGQIGVLLREFEKRARHLPIRKLIAQAGNAIQAIKPVFMMSPMSIAVYVPPGSVTFDLVIFDEASQVKPVDAFGATLRGDQVVVVGDSKQLPPTSFFDALVGEDEPVDDDESVTADVESILGLMAGQGAPQRMLRWHYRSRHDSLIALSNQEFYDNRLVVFPSPESRRRGFGLVFHHLPNTVYDRGKSRTNQKEAEIVAKAVMLHAKTAPQLTLGVAAFSLPQAEAILDHLERLRRDDPSAESFFSGHEFEPFFVKNLESVQGDERDVIFISVGYGRDEQGYFSMNFGALNGVGGERRLNVLITRARCCCEVFTNLTHEDIDLTRTRTRGVEALKAFLRFAQTGISDVPDDGQEEEDSPFEREVANALRTAGCDVVRQVGSGGFRIDLAIRDPERPGRYILGIECDGATYHRARAARDRDRLRQQVLESLGWHIHRIWSTDWFTSPDRELRRTLEAIGIARVKMDQKADRAQPVSPQGSEGSDVPVERDGPQRSVEAETLTAEPYQVGNPEVRLRGSELHEVPVARFGAWIAEVVRAEGPVHRDEVIRRIADAAGVKRVGNRIEATFDQSTQAAVRAGTIERRGDFLWPSGMTQVKVRDRSDLPQSSRKIELIPPEEIAAGIRQVAGEAYGIKLSELAPAVCRLFGFLRTTEDMVTVVRQVVAKLHKAGHIEIEDELVTVVRNGTSADHPGLRLVPGKG